LYEIYFGKTRDIVNGLRSVQPLSDSKQQDELRKDLFQALAKKNVPKSE
jgi:capping protein beta